MTCWILIFPSIWLVGRSTTHDEILIPMLDPPSVLHKEEFMKYTEHPIVRFTHMVPGGVWSTIIPFQLHTTFRKSHGKIHRYMGYMFLVCSFLMSTGLAVLMIRNLNFEDSFGDLPAIPLWKSSKPKVVILGIWFTWTALRALICARRRRFLQHQYWIIRHIASGIFVAVQRVVLITYYHYQYPRPVSRQDQRFVFGDSAQRSAIVCILIGELTIHLLMQQQQQQKANSKKA